MDDIIVRDARIKEKFFLDDEYLNGYARLCGWKATLVYLCLCRHADRNQEAFPSQDLIAEKVGISRSSVFRAIKALEEWNIIKLSERERKPDGSYRNYVYILLDKSVWKNKPCVTVTSGHTDTQPVVTQTHGHVSQGLNKDTHIVKDTHNKDITKVIGPSVKKGENKDVSLVIDYLTSKLGAPLDGTLSNNRRFAYNLLNKLAKTYPDTPPVQLVGKLIDLAYADPFHRGNATSFYYLYYNAQKIIQSHKGPRAIRI